MWGLLTVSFHPWAHIVQVTKTSPRATVWIVKWALGVLKSFQAGRHFMKCRRCWFIATRISFSFCGALPAADWTPARLNQLQGAWLARQITIIVSSINRVAFQLFFLKLDGLTCTHFKYIAPKCAVCCCAILIIGGTSLASMIIWPRESAYYLSQDAQARVRFAHPP
jgi:hypothetical protein